MEVRITSRHGELQEKEREYAEEKLESLTRYFKGTRSLEVVLDEGHQTRNAEIIAHMARGAPLVVSAEAGDVFAAIDRAHDKLERMLRRLKEKIVDRRHGRDRAGAAFATAPEGEEDEDSQEGSVPDLG